MKDQNCLNYSGCTSCEDEIKEKSKTKLKEKTDSKDPEVKDIQVSTKKNILRGMESVSAFKEINSDDYWVKSPEDVEMLKYIHITGDLIINIKGTMKHLDKGTGKLTYDFRNLNVDGYICFLNLEGGYDYSRSTIDYKPVPMALLGKPVGAICNFESRRVPLTDFADFFRTSLLSLF